MRISDWSSDVCSSDLKGAQIALGSEDFKAAMAAMARLRQPVDAFFDEVTVNADDKALRENRLQLLSAIGATLAEVADFSKIRSEERRVGNEWVSPCRSRWSQYH